ncbi:MAG: hypothetical protein JRJ42_08245 [Deltaproteobacteria bacterium]|nr:hypothetical protein [Deltaproteobacteria bacterium]
MLIFFLLVVKTLLFAFLIPPWQGPDEPFHFKVSYVLSDPLTDIEKLNTDMVKSLQRHRFREYTDYTQNDCEIPGFDVKNLQGYHAIIAFMFRSISDVALIWKMFLGRLFSASCYIVISLLVYGISRRIFTGAEGRWVSIASVSFVGFQPQYSFFSITLNSDNLINLLLTVILFCMVHISSTGQKAVETGISKCWLWLVAILAVVMSLSVKRTGLMGFLLFCISMLIIKYRDKRSLIKASVVSLAVLALFFFFIFFSWSKQGFSNKYINQCAIRFDGVPGDVKVSYQAFDINLKREVVVLLNGKEVAKLKRTESGAWGPTYVLNLPDKLVNDDASNVLTFDNVYNPPRFYTWGVKNVRIGGVLKVKKARGNIPLSCIIDEVSPLKQSIIRLGEVAKTIYDGIIKLGNIPEIPFNLIMRFILVQFVSFWFSLGWMIYKMSLGWYVLFGLITLVSLAGMIRLIYTRFRNRKFEFINMRIVSLLLLLFALSQIAMVVAYGPLPTSSINDAMGRCRFMEIGALSVLIPLGLWAISPARKRDMVMKFFVCFMIFLNMVSVFKYIIPIFYL